MSCVSTTGSNFCGLRHQFVDREARHFDQFESLPHVRSISRFRR